MAELPATLVVAEVVKMALSSTYSDRSLCI